MSLTLSTAFAFAWESLKDLERIGRRNAAAGGRGKGLLVEEVFEWTMDPILPRE